MKTQQKERQQEKIKNYSKRKLNILWHVTLEQNENTSGTKEGRTKINANHTPVLAAVIYSEGTLIAVHLRHEIK